MSPAPWLEAGEPIGLRADWSRSLTAPDAEGTPRRWHLLDSHAGQPPADVAGLPTLVCVHGNPTWSYLWRGLLASAPEGWRVIAPDQLGMGYSEPAAGTLTAPRRLDQRIDDLTALTEALELSGPLVAVGHDWGGPVVTGWALRHDDRLRGLVLANTTLHHDRSTPFSPLIRLARRPGLLSRVCVDTPVFLRGATALSRPRLDRDVRAGLELPYRDAASRQRIGQFVADVPLTEGHRSAATLDAVAEAATGLDVPALLLRGTADPVFTETHLHDLMARFPGADVHRYEGASHLVTEDRPEYAATLWQWVAERVAPGLETPASTDASSPVPVAAVPEPSASETTASETTASGTAAETPAVRPLWWRQQARAEDPTTAIVEMDSGRRTSFAELDADIVATARGLHEAGVRPGQRVGVLVPPGIDLTVVVYACWRLGAVIVVADAGLGLRPLGRALRGARPDWVVGIGVALVAARAMRVPGQQLLVGELPRPLRRRFTPAHRLGELQHRGRRSTLDLEPVRRQGLDARGDADCAVLFTSGATGPAKGVVYRLSQIGAQVEVLRETLRIGEDDRFVAAFAPFALYGPAMGAPAAVPDMVVTSPSTLSATALADAVARLGATVVFASPAALVNVLETAGELSPEQREALGGVKHLMSAGAPVPVGLLRRLTALVPAAELHTPYGMTEALPVADITLRELETVGTGEGVCVGLPRPGVEVRIAPLPAQVDGEDGPLGREIGVTGEICVSSAHVKDRYDRLWATQQAASPAPRWHRTGDVGHLDAQDRLWVEGRRVHVVHTADGPVTPVGIEQRVEELAEVRQACVAAVGPVGTQQVVLVLVPETGAGGEAADDGAGGLLAAPELAARVRSVAQAPVAAVLCVPALPLDIRHQSKIDRVAVARWADRVLQGERPGPLVPRRLARRRGGRARGKGGRR